MITSLQTAAIKSLKAKSSQEHDAKFTIEVDGKSWSCYTVSIAQRDLLLYCDEGTASFFVDTYGGRMAIELIDWEEAV